MQKKPDEISQEQVAKVFMHNNTAHIRLIGGQAEVQIGGRAIRVSRRDVPGEPYHCPVELVAAALGS